jgi:hypothetical protein
LEVWLFFPKHLQEAMEVINEQRHIHAIKANVLEGRVVQQWGLGV